MDKAATINNAKKDVSANIKNDEWYRKIWQYIHSPEFTLLPFNKQLAIFEKIIINDLAICSCGQDSHFIITFMLDWLVKTNRCISSYDGKKQFWIQFHNYIRLKLFVNCLFKLF